MTLLPQPFQVARTLIDVKKIKENTSIYFTYIKILLIFKMPMRKKTSSLCPFVAPVPFWIINCSQIIVLSGFTQEWFFIHFAYIFVNSGRKFEALSWN